MFSTKYEVSLRPYTDCFKSSPRSPFPNFPLRYFTVRRIRLSVGAVDTTSESLGGVRLGFSVGGDSGWALWLLVATAYLQRVMLQWVHSRGLWLPGPLVLFVLAGGLRGSLPGVHESINLVRCTGGQPITADRSHSSGCQQDEPSASLVTTGVSHASS